MACRVCGRRFGGWRALAAALAALFAGQTVHSEDVAWKPTAPVEVVVGVGPGGGTDVYARLIQKIVHDQKLVQVPLSIVNKAGGGGALGLAYVAQRPADGHTISVGNATLITTQIMGRSAIGYADVTPVSMLAQEYVAFAVKADSPIRTGKDLLARLKQHESSLSIAIGAAVGNQNHIAMALIAKSIGVDPRKLKTVIFKSGGETITALLGGHVDVGMTSSIGFAKHVEAGRLRVIAVSAPRRLEGEFANVPTWKELGADSVAGNWYAVYGPRNMPAGPVGYWEWVLAAMVKSEDWRNYVRARQMSSRFLGHQDTEKFFRAEHDKEKAVLIELGLAS